MTVGASYADRGIRPDKHDFFGVALPIPMFDKNPRGQKRQQVVAGGATHSAGPESPQDKRATQESGSSSKDKPSPRPTSSTSGASQLAAPSPSLAESLEWPFAQSDELRVANLMMLMMYF